MIQICPFRHSSDKVAKLESQVESYKKKLEDLGDLRRQVKLLEEKNTMYMQNTVSLEEELRKANAARSQLETYKRQVRTGIISAIVLCLLQHFVFITRLISQSKKKNMKETIPVWKTSMFYRCYLCSPFPAILVITTSLLLCQKAVFLAFKNSTDVKRVFFPKITPNSYSVAGLELEAVLSGKVSPFHL